MPVLSFLLAAASVGAPTPAPPVAVLRAPRLDEGGRIEPASVPLRRRPAPDRLPARRAFPVGGRVTWGDGFGERVGGHDGVDVLASCATPLRAVRAGRVALRASDGAAGRHLVVRVAGGAEHVYMHLKDVAVQQGDRVAAGDRLGSVGDSGNATTCHLHFEAWSAPGWHRGAARDPERMLRALVRRRG